MELISLGAVIFSFRLWAVEAVKGVNDCTACTNLADTFLHGLTQTKKAHFGGGNTAWEEERLGKYHNSEVRYHDVTDYVCKPFDGFKLEKDDEHKCHTFMADYEEEIESWYFHKQTQFPDLRNWLCIETTKTCCPKNTWGAECQPCPGDPQRPCFGRGKCDGESTRKGTGKCKCNKGYQGNLCRKCANNYFASFQNDTDITCENCNVACVGGCSGPDARHCVNCKIGWKLVENEGCQDVDECENNPCKDENEICKNNIGAFSCHCKQNYKKENGLCILDIANVDDNVDATDDEDIDKFEISGTTNEQEVENSAIQEQVAIEREGLKIPEIEPEGQKMQDSTDDVIRNPDIQRESYKNDDKVQESQQNTEVDKPNTSHEQMKENMPEVLQKVEQPKSKADANNYEKPSPKIPPTPEMAEEHRRKVRDHLKQVMDTIESLGKGGGPKQRRNFQYSDPNVQSVMDRLDKMKKDGSGPLDNGIHKVEF